MWLRSLAPMLLFWVAFASVSVAERPSIKTFTTEQGLVSDALVSSIQQDAQGFLWIATHEGVSRFDGAHFRNYGVAQGFPVPSQVYSILITSTGDIWAGLAAARYMPNGPEQPRFRPILVGERKVRPISFLEDYAHAVWALADGLYRNRTPERTDAFERVCLTISPDCRSPDGVGEAFLEGRDHSIWIADQWQGLIRLQPSGKVDRFGMREGLRHKVLCLLLDREGDLWAGTTHGFVHLVASPVPGRSVVAQDSTRLRGSPACAVHALLQTRDGHIWAGTRCGLIEVQGSRTRTYTVADGLSQAVIQSVFEDQDGDLWIGTESAGVMRMSRKQILTYGPESGLEQEVIDGTILSRDGRVVVLANRNGRFIIKSGDQQGFHPLLPPLPLQPTDLGTQHWQVALQDHMGDWWVPGTNTLQVFRGSASGTTHRAKQIQAYDEHTGLPAGRIDCMVEDLHGDLWFGLYSPPHSALWQWVRSTGRFRSWGSAPGVPTDRVPLGLTVTRSGALWVAYSGGDIGRYREGKHTLLKAGPEPGNGIFAIHEDDTGRLWTGRRNSRFYEIENPEGDLPSLREIPEVKAPFLRCILNDARGRLYLTSEAGLLQYDPNTGVVRHFHERDGLPTDVVQNGVRDRTGALWFGTGRGLMRFVPVDAPFAQPPPVWIDEVSVGGVPYSGLSDRGETDLHNVRFASSAGALRLDFNSISFNSDVRFQYRLDPVDRDWNPPDAVQSVTFAGLRAGHYLFQVRALDPAARVSSPATVAFVVLPPFWQRLWFVSLCFLVLCSVLRLAYRSRVQHLLQMEQMRMRIASDLHDEIGASLTQIAILSEGLIREGRPRGAVGERLQKVADTAREITSSLGDVVWSISPGADQLPDLLSRIRRIGNDLCDAHQIDFALQEEGSAGLYVNGHVRHQVLLIFKEALRNAVRHSRCDHFCVHCTRDGSRVLFTFSDDGIGFELANGSQGVGVASMRRRAESVHGRFVIVSERGKGTSVSVQINQT